MSNTVGQDSGQNNNDSAVFAPLIDEVIAARKFSERNAGIYAWLDHLCESREQSEPLFSCRCPIEHCSHGYVAFSGAVALDEHMQAYHPTWKFPTDIEYMKSGPKTDDASYHATAGLLTDGNPSVAESKSSAMSSVSFNANTSVGDHGSTLETYYGCVMEVIDAVLLVEACRVGLLSPVPPYSYHEAERPGCVCVYRMPDFAQEGMLSDEESAIDRFFHITYTHTVWDVQDPQGTRWIVQWYDLHVQESLLDRPAKDLFFAPIHDMLVAPPNSLGMLHFPEGNGHLEDEGYYQGAKSSGGRQIGGPPTDIPADSGYASSISRARGKLEHQNKESAPETGQVTLANTTSDNLTMNRDLLEESETESIYSELSAVSDSRMGYLSEFADELVKVVRPHQLDEEIMLKVSNALPALLKAFALSLGHGQSTAMHREAMVFIHKYRRDIVTAFRERVFDDGSETRRHQAGMDMSLNEIMDLWQEKSEETQHESSNSTDFEVNRFRYSYVRSMEPSALFGGEAGDEEDEEKDWKGEETCEQELPRLEAYRSLIHDTPTYNWLLSNIRNECTLYTPGRGSSMEIRNTLLESLPASTRVSRQKPTETLNASFRIYWDPVYYLGEEGYGESLEKAVERILTFTGSGPELQAKSCGAYVRRTWPSTGEAILQILKELVSTKRKGTVTLADGTRVDISRRPSLNGEPLMDTWVDACGTAACIAEVGEQLAWVASALQSTEDKSTCVCTKPCIKFTRADHILSKEDSPSRLVFEIDIEKYEIETNADSCWLGLVSRPAIVEGYPISRRPPGCPPGLEVQLDVMARLLGTRKVSRFYERTVLKGFSTLLAPTRSTNGVVNWHLVQESDDKRISYHRCMGFPEVDLSIDQLEKSRHILGWCPEVRLYAGAVDANYNISDSRLPRRGGLRILKDASLSSDHFITEDPSCSLGRRHIRLRRNGYMSKLKWIAGNYMTLWDSEEEKGWLINGASGLLHLVRASLKREESDPALRPAILLKPDDIHEASETHRPHAALEVLLNMHNLGLRIYHVDADVTFKDRVEDYYDQLEKLFDYQTIGLRNDQNVPRSLLEGWDFQDLTHERDPIYPRHTALHQEGLSWVDFTRSINAITLFGRDFGEVMRPVNTCSRSSSLTPRKSYLAATVSDLNKVMASNGDLYSVPIQLTRDTVWHVAESTFVSCSCEGSGQNHRTAAIQSLLPYPMRGEPPARLPGNRGNNGAVIFGFDTANKWFWGENGLPSRTPAWSSCDVPMKESHSFYSDDSGLGSSLSSSADRASNAPTGSSSQDDKRPWPRLGIPSSVDNHCEGRRFNTPSPMQYKVGIVCALHIELMAVRALFDMSHPSVRIPDEDPNYYVFGRIQGHNVVAVCLPHGLYGTSAATDVASHMRRSFPSLRFCLLVGIGAGVPSSKNDIRLGDVVVSVPAGHYSGVLPYDMVKSLEAGESQLNRYLCPPPQTLMCAISELESDPDLSLAPLERYLQDIHTRKPQYAHPGADKDQLFNSEYHHPTEHDTCANCNPAHIIKRPLRLTHHQKIFYGLIASGNKLVRSAHERDKLGKEHNVLCIEMEGAGIMNIFPCLIIRGICDYADSHKNKTWQHYASAVAAAYAKLLLSRVRTSDDARSSFSTDAGADVDVDGGLSRKRLSLLDWEDELPNKRRNTGWELSRYFDLEVARVGKPVEVLDSYTNIMDVQ